jgi:cyclase
MRRTGPPFAIMALLASMHSVPVCVAKDYGKVTGHKVAEGVYLFTTTAYADVGLSGNSVAILSDEGVLVFDSSATPETAATVLAEIRKLTDKRVRYLVNSHWHWDHWGGNQIYQAAFPVCRLLRMKKRASSC